MNQTLKMFLLGTPRVILPDGQTVIIENPLMLQLLAMLLLNPQRTFLRAELSALFYPDHDKKQAEQNLRQMIHRLRKALLDMDDTAALLLREPFGLQLNPQRAVWVDVGEFNERVQRVQTHAHRRMAICSRCIQDLEAAAELYRGEFMSGTGFQEVMEEWAFIQHNTLMRKMIFVLETLRVYKISGVNGVSRQE